VKCRILRITVSSKIQDPKEDRSMTGRHFMTGFLILALAASAPIPVLAADGDLDPTFGIGGRVRYEDSSGWPSASASAIQSDGKIIVAGSIGGLDWADFLLARYNPDGSLDTSFGIAGKVTTDFLGWGDWVRAVAVQSDGKIIAAGIMAILPNGTPYADLRVRRGALVRYNKDGSLDSTFGTGGKVITEILGPSALNALSIQSDGKIIAAGHSGVLNGSVSNGTWFEIFRSGPTGMDFALVRYNDDGSLDTTFGAEGKVVTDLNSPADVINAISLQPDGKIIAAGNANAGLADWGSISRPISVYGLARYNRDGSLDTTFGIGGKVRMDLPLARLQLLTS
jgi:uncharacterized delta-60 repeat protein